MALREKLYAEGVANPEHLKNALSSLMEPIDEQSLIYRLCKTRTNIFLVLSSDH